MKRVKNYVRVAKKSFSRSGPRNSGMEGSINFGGSNSLKDISGQVHLLPCVIKHEGPCSVSHYFKPRSTGEVSDGMAVKEAFFRGRKLQGANISLPEGYSGYVLSKEGKSQADERESSSNQWTARGEFKNITYWNHDALPSSDDPLRRCFHWFSVSDALHKPVTASDMASLNSASS